MSQPLLTCAALGVLVGCAAQPQVSPRPELRVYFIGADIFAPDQPSDLVPVTAVGGTQTIRLLYSPTYDNVFVDLDLPYTATLSGTDAVIESSQDALVTVRGITTGESTLRITAEDGTVLGSTSISTRAATQVLVFTNGEAPAFSVAAEDLGPAVFGAGEVPLSVVLGDSFAPAAVNLEAQVVDAALHLSGPATAIQSEWDLLDITAATPSDHQLAITLGAGAPTFVVPIRIVDHPDAVTLVGSTDQSVHTPRSICFVATSNDEVIRGLTWTFVVDSGTASSTSSYDRCPVISSTGAASVTVHATAGGMTTSVTLPAT